MREAASRRRRLRRLAELSSHDFATPLLLEFAPSNSARFDRRLRMLRGFAAFGVALALCGPAAATPGMTTSPTVMRDAPRSHAHVVQSIPANAQIDIGGCGKYWCSASWRDLSGFVATRAVSTAGGPPLYANAIPPGPAYVGPPPVVVAPYYGWGWGWRRRYWW
jgi:uncharacterized protein YraI